MLLYRRGSRRIHSASRRSPTCSSRASRSRTCSGWPATPIHAQRGSMTAGRRRSRATSSSGFRFDESWRHSPYTARQGKRGHAKLLILKDKGPPGLISIGPLSSRSRLYFSNRLQKGFQQFGSLMPEHLQQEGSIQPASVLPERYVLQKSL